MDSKAYRHGYSNGGPPLDTEYGSDAYWSAAAGAQARAAERQRDAAYKPSQVAEEPDGESHDGAGASVLVVSLICVFIAVSTLFSFTVHWREHPYPYKLVALFYYALVTLPLQGFAWVWSTTISGVFGGYSFWSVAVALMAELAYVVALMLVAATLRAAFKRLRLSYWWLLAPAGFGLVWWVGALVF